MNCRLFRLPLIILFFIFTAGGRAFAVTGGPDDFGYTYADSEESEVTYEWVDISALNPVTLNLEDDGESTAIDIGFPFVFYGVPYNFTYIHANGFIKFDAEVYEYFMGDQCPLPSKDDVNGMIAFFLRDHNPAETVSGDIRYASDAASSPKRFIVEFDNIAACCSPWGTSGTADGPNPVSVQLVLYENGEFQVNVRDPGPHQGGDTTIGLEAPEAISGLNYRGCLLRGSVLPQTGIRFYPPTSGTPVVPRTLKKWGRPGDNLEFNFTIFNLEPDTVTLTVQETTSSWSPTLSANSIVIGSGSSSPFTLQLEIPSGAADGASDVSTIVFTPQGGGSPVTVTAVAVVQDAWTNDFWQQLPDVPMKLEMPSAAALGNYIYIIGGTRQDELSPDVFYTESAVHRYNVSTNIWESSTDGVLAPLPEGRRGHASCGINGKIYVMGGYGETGGEPQIAWDLFIYDEASNTWSTGNPMPSGRVEFSAVCDSPNNKIYVMGGIINRVDTTLENAELSNDMVIYDIPTGRWTGGAQMNYYRYDFVAGMLDDETIIVAGNAYDIPAARTAEVYSIADDVWTPIDELTVVRATAAGGVPTTGKFCIAGGFNLVAAYGREDTFECFTGLYWIPQHALLNVPRNNMASATLNGQIYAIAGDWVDTSGMQPELKISGAFERYPHSPIPDVSPDEVSEPTGEQIEEISEVTEIEEDIKPDAGVEPRPDVITDGIEEIQEEGEKEEEGGGCGCTIAY